MHAETMLVVELSCVHKRNLAIRGAGYMKYPVSIQGDVYHGLVVACANLKKIGVPARW